MFQVGDEVQITCKYIPGTGILVQGETGTVTTAPLPNGLNYRVELSRKIKYNNSIWFFGTSDLVLLNMVQAKGMVDPEFTLDEIELGREVMDSLQRD